MRRPYKSLTDRHNFIMNLRPSLQTPSQANVTNCGNHETKAKCKPAHCKVKKDN